MTECRSFNENFTLKKATINNYFIFILEFNERKMLLDGDVFFLLTIK